MNYVQIRVNKNQPCYILIAGLMGQQNINDFRKVLVEILEAMRACAFLIGIHPLDKADQILQINVTAQCKHRL